MSNPQMSFLPEDYIERRIERRTNLIFLSLFAVVLLGVVGAFFVSSNNRRLVRAAQDAVNRDFAEATSKLQQLQQLEAQKQQMLAKARLTGALLEPVPRSFLFAELINRMPPTLSLTEFDMGTRVIKARVVPQATASALKNKQAAAKPATAGGKAAPGAAAMPDIPKPPTISTKISLVGVAPTDVQIAQYMTSLQQSPLLEDVNILFSEESRVNNELMRRFKIEMYINTAADVRDIEPLLVNRVIKTDPITGEALGPAETSKLGGLMKKLIAGADAEIPSTTPDKE